MPPRMKLRPIKIYTSKASQKTFQRHDVTIPAAALTELGWASGIQLDWEIEDDTLVLRPAKPAKKAKKT